MKLAIVIVTCNAEARLMAHLLQLEKQNKRPHAVIVVNNGTRNVEWVKKKFGKHFNVDVVEIGANIGPAGGFKIGSKRAYALGYDYIIFADDDALPAEDAIEHFYEDAAKGMEVVTGYYSNGQPVSVSNHYMMIHKSVFARIGFYFDPFFLMSEDVEFMERLQTMCKIHWNEKIIIKHPWRLTTNSARWYLSIRNVFVHMAMSGRIFAYMFYFYYYLTRAFFLLFLKGKDGFSFSFFIAFAHFLQGKTGNTGVKGDEMRLKEISADELKDAGKSVFIATDLKNINPPFESENLEVFREGEFFGETVRSSPLRSITNMISNIMKFRGKNLIIANQFFAAYPPLSVWAREIYLYDELNKKMYFYYMNNPFLSTLLLVLIVPLWALAFPVALGGYLLKRGYYKKMYDRKIAEDLEFCKQCDRKAAREAS